MQNQLGEDGTRTADPSRPTRWSVLPLVVLSLKAGVEKEGGVFFGFPVGYEESG